MKHSLYLIRATLVIVSGIFTLVTACKKDKKDSAKPATASRTSLIGKIAGNRLMHGFEDTAQTNTYYSTFALPDTAVTLIVVNDSTITIGNAVLKYTSGSSTDSTMYFSQITQSGGYEEASVCYFFQKDSVVFDRLILVVPNGFVDKKYYTY